MFSVLPAHGDAGGGGVVCMLGVHAGFRGFMLPMEILCVFEVRFC